MPLGPDDITPTDHATADTIMTAATQRLQVEVITRAHDAGKAAGIVECRKRCEVIKRDEDKAASRATAVGYVLTLATVVVGFAAYVAVRFGFGAELAAWICR